jgi:hypothetical protein
MLFRNTSKTIILTALAASSLSIIPGIVLGDDTTAPELVEFDFSPKTINISMGQKSLIFTLRVIDDLSGVDFGHIFIVSPSGGQMQRVGFSGEGELDYSGQITISFPQYSEAGIWEIYIGLHDEVGNGKIISTQELDDLGFPTEIHINANQPPIANPNGPYTGFEGDNIEFFSNGSYDPDGTVIAYLWDFGDGSTSTEENPIYVYQDNGIYPVVLTATDDDGLTDTDPTEASIANVEPSIADLTYVSEIPGLILPRHLIFFSGSFTDPGNLDTHTGLWDFDDETFDEGELTEENEPPDATGAATSSHAYEHPGTYIVTLTITDDDGDSGELSMEIIVPTGAQASDIINDNIQILPPDVFDKNPDERKAAFSERFADVASKIKSGDLNGTIQLLENTASKMNGCFGGLPENDWITDCNAQEILLFQIDALIGYIQSL